MLRIDEKNCFSFQVNGIDNNFEILGVNEQDSPYYLTYFCKKIGAPANERHYFVDLKPGVKKSNHSFVSFKPNGTSKTHFLYLLFQCEAGDTIDLPQNMSVYMAPKEESKEKSSPSSMEIAQPDQSKNQNQEFNKNEKTLKRKRDDDHKEDKPSSKQKRHKRKEQWHKDEKRATSKRERSEQSKKTKPYKTKPYIERLDKITNEFFSFFNQAAAIENKQKLDETCKLFFSHTIPYSNNENSIDVIAVFLDDISRPYKPITYLKQAKKDQFQLLANMGNGIFLLLSYILNSPNQAQEESRPIATLLHRLAKFNDKIYTQFSNVKDKQKARYQFFHYLKSEQIAAFIKRLLKANPNAQEIANLIWGSGKLSEHGETRNLLEKINSQHLFDLVNLLLQTNPQSQAIGNTMWGFAKLSEHAETRELLKNITPKQLSDFVDLLLKANPSDQNIANTIWGFCKLSEHRETRKLLEKINSQQFFDLVDLLLQAHPNTQTIANTIWGFAKLSEHDETRELLKNIEPKLLSYLIDLLLKANPSDQEIGNTIWPLSKLANQLESRFLIETIKPEQLTKLIDRLFIQTRKKNNIDKQRLVNQVVEGLDHLGQFRKELLKDIKANPFIPLINEAWHQKRLLTIFRSLTKSLFIVTKAASNLSAHDKQMIFDFILNFFQLQESNQRKFRSKNEVMHLKYLEPLMFLAKCIGSVRDFKDHFNLGVQRLFMMRLSFNQLEHIVNLAETIHPFLDKENQEKLIDLIQKEMGLHPEALQKRMKQQLAQCKLMTAEDSIAISKPAQEEEEEEPNLLKREHRVEVIGDIRDRPPIIAPKREIKKYSVQSKSDMQVLAQKIRKEDANNSEFIYDFDANKKRLSLDLFVAETSQLHGQWGVFANQNLKADPFKTFACYAGNLIQDPEEEDENSHYLFRLEDDTSIEAWHIGDFTRFMNHSQTPNVIAREKTISGKTNIYFYLVQDVKEGEELTFDYGLNYFRILGYMPFNIHAQNNLYTNAEQYEQNQKHYFTDLFQFDVDTKKDLGLNPEVCWLLPKIFKAIGTNTYLDFDHHADLLAYACTKNGLAETIYQQHLSPLMYACYLGRENWIQELIKKGASVDRCMLVEGLTPFTLLCKGHADIQTVEKMGLLLLEKCQYVQVLNKYEFNYLHYAIKRNSLVLVKELIKIAEKEAYDFFANLFDRDKNLPDHADFDYCIQHDQLDMLKLLLDSMLRSQTQLAKKLQETIDDGVIFKEESFVCTSTETLQKLNDILFDYQNKYNLNVKEVLTRLQPYIPNRVEEHAQDKSSAHFAKLFTTPPANEASVLANQSFGRKHL